MRQRKRLVGVVSLAAVLGLLAAACGSDNKDNSISGGPSGASGTTAAAASGGTDGGSGTCKSGTGEVPPIATGKADGKGKKVGLLFDVTGRGDKSFNDAAATGLDKAKADYGITGTESTPTTPDGSDRPPRIKEMAGKQDLIVAVGFLWADAVTASAAPIPNQHYAIVDSVVYKLGADGKPTTTLAPNVRSMTFAEQEGSFLVGVAAACASKSG